MTTNQLWRGDDQNVVRIGLRVPHQTVTCYVRFDNWLFSQAGSPRRVRNVNFSTMGTASIVLRFGLPTMAWFDYVLRGVSLLIETGRRQAHKARSAVSKLII